MLTPIMCVQVQCDSGADIVRGHEHRTRLLHQLPTAASPEHHSSQSGPGSHPVGDLCRYYVMSTTSARANHLRVSGHRPMYVDSAYPSVSAAPLQQLVEPLLLTHGVDLALWSRGVPFFLASCAHPDATTSSARLLRTTVS